MITSAARSHRFTTVLEKGHCVHSTVTLSTFSLSIRYVDRSGTRTVRYRDSLKFYLKEWLDTYRNNYFYARKSPYLFPSNNSENIGVSVLDDAVKNAAEAAGIQEVLYIYANRRKRRKYTPYCLRHFYASQMASELTPAELADLMGLFGGYDDEILRGHSRG